MSDGSGQALLLGSLSPSSLVVTSWFSNYFLSILYCNGTLKTECKKLVVGLDYEDFSRFREGEGTCVSVGFSISVCVGLAGDALP